MEKVIKPETIGKLGLLAAVSADVQRLVCQMLREADTELSPEEKALVEGVIEVHRQYKEAVENPGRAEVEKSEEQKIAELLANWHRIDRAYETGGVMGGIKADHPKNWRYLFSGECFVALDSGFDASYFLFSPGMNVRLFPKLQEFFSLEGDDSFRDQNEQSRSFDIVRPARIRVDENFLKFAPDAQVDYCSGGQLKMGEAVPLLNHKLIEKGVLRRKEGKKGKR